MAFIFKTSHCNCKPRGIFNREILGAVSFTVNSLGKCWAFYSCCCYYYDKTFSVNSCPLSEFQLYGESGTDSLCVQEEKSDFPACLFQKGWERWRMLANKTRYPRRRRKIEVLYGSVCIFGFCHWGYISKQHEVKQISRAVHLIIPSWP